MQQDPLIAAGDAERRTGLVVGEPFDISQDEDLTLTWREVLEAGAEDRRQGGGVETVLAVLRPALNRISPLALRIEAAGIDGMK